MVSCLSYIKITNSSDHMRVWTANLLHTKSLPNPLGHKSLPNPLVALWISGLGNDFMQEILSSIPHVVTGICDPNIIRTRHHCSLKLSSKLKYISILSLLFTQQCGFRKGFSVQYCIIRLLDKRKQCLGNPCLVFGVLLNDLPKNLTVFQINY